MKKPPKKKGKARMILWILAAAVAITGTLLPKTGSLVILDEVCDSALLWIIFIYVSVYALRDARDDEDEDAEESDWERPSSEKKRRGKRAIRAVVLTGLLICCVWFTSDITLDIASGYQRTTLDDVRLSHSQSHTGLFSRHYYLLGTTPDGELLRVEISASDYERLSEAGQVTMDYLPHTKRVKEYSFTNRNFPPGIAE